MQKNNNNKKKSFTGMLKLSSVTPAIVRCFMMLLKNKYQLIKVNWIQVTERLFNPLSSSSSCNRTK